MTNTNTNTKTATPNRIACGESADGYFTVCLEGDKVWTERRAAPTHSKQYTRQDILAILDRVQPELERLEPATELRAWCNAESGRLAYAALSRVLAKYDHATNALGAAFDTDADATVIDQLAADARVLKLVAKLSNIAWYTDGAIIYSDPSHSFDHMAEIERLMER